jgi:uncharacterized protein YqgC (DUF456 family)
MSYFYLTLFCVFLAAGLIAVPFTLPGTWIMLIAAILYSLVRVFQSTSDLKVILIVAGLAVVGEIVEFLTGTLGPKKVNVSTRAIIASVIGGIVGALVGVPIFLVGALLGLFLGTFLGALTYALIKEGNVETALRQAFAVLTSRVISVFAKTAIAAGMAVYLVMKVF